MTKRKRTDVCLLDDDLIARVEEISRKASDYNTTTKDNRDETLDSMNSAIIGSTSIIANIKDKDGLNLDVEMSASNDLSGSFVDRKNTKEGDKMFE